MKYFGQDGLDKYIHKNFIKAPVKDGTFLELGADNGLKFSNTKFFEDHMGFNKGVLIEPDPQSFEMLKTNRPNCECFNYAVHSSLSEVNFLQSDQSLVGTIADVATEDFKQKWHQESNTIKVLAERLDFILSNSTLEYIDFWSLDTEGSELECLLSMNWEIPVGLICVEMNRDENEIDSILTSNGFTLAGKHKQGRHKNIINKIYINKNYFRNNNYFKY